MQPSIINLGQVFASGPAYATPTGAHLVPIKCRWKDAHGTEHADAACLHVSRLVMSSFLSQNAPIKSGDALEFTSRRPPSVRVASRDVAEPVYHAETLTRAAPRWPVKPQEQAA